MSKLAELIYVPRDEKPYINFEASLDDDQVVAGYVPVKSTIDVLDFLDESTGLSCPKGRAVICVGAYGSGKSRLCTVLSRLFRDGFECGALERVFKRLEARGQSASLVKLKHTLMPAGRAWRPWLVVPMYADAGGGSVSASLIRGLVKSLRRANIDDTVLGQTVYHAAARRLDKLTQAGSIYQPMQGSTFSTVDQLKRALEQDFDEHALREFCEFHKLATHGVDFRDIVHSSLDVALQPHEIYNTVAQRIQLHGYDGIVVLWDEFGLAIEELLRGASTGRSLGLEAQALQDFIERSCSTNELGRRIVFLGFTHRSIEEYGTRASLNENDRNRLATTSGRFRNPPIFIRLSVTETEGYHLLAGMMHRTPAGEAIFSNPVLRLQRISERMPKYNLWANLSPKLCYSDIAGACYPLHPTTAASLLLLSDQIAQVNRTTFYYLQNQNEGGLAGALESRDVPNTDDLGSSELLRIHDLFRFFEQPIKENRRHLLDQYEEAVARFPTATELEIAVLRVVLILSAIKNPDVTPTTDFLSFCLADVHKEEEGAKIVHDALARLSEAHALWKNEATDVWSFVGERGLGTELDRELDEERLMIPKELPCDLIRRYPQLQEELVDRLGDADLDPCDSGIVRTIAVQILDASSNEDAIQYVNPAVNGEGRKWRSAMVYLAAVDSAAQLDSWRKISSTSTKSNVYFVFPPSPLSLNADKLRDLIAVQNLLKVKEPRSHAYEVLEGKLTKLRKELRDEFEKTFGNEGLRSGTAVERTGQPQVPVPVNSWNELLPAIGADLDAEFRYQLRVRCGTYNEWQVGSKWAPIKNIVERILGFDNHTPWQVEFLDFNETSQDAAIVDGVLVENQLLTHNSLNGKWELARPSQDSPHEVLREILRHFQTGGAGDREFVKLFNRLIEPPYGIPNGIIPLLVALVFRAEPAKIGVYHKSGSQWQRVPDGELPEALVGMARWPDRYATRFNKLTGKQRFVFKTLGPEMNLPFSDRMTGERFYSYCEEVRNALRKWVMPLPDGILAIPDLTDIQKKLLKLLRGPVPPQLSLLADTLVDVIQEDSTTHEELADAGNQLTTFPATVLLWQSLRTRISRHVEGIKAPVRSALREVMRVTSPEESSMNLGHVVQAIKPIERLASGNDSLRQLVLRLESAPDGGDLVEEVAAAISNKPTANLTDEDYGRAVGMLDVFAALGPATDGDMVLVMPGGERRSLPSVDNPAARAQIQTAIQSWQDSFGLTPDQVAALAISEIYSKGAHNIDYSTQPVPDVDAATCEKHVSGDALDANSPRHD